MKFSEKWLREWVNPDITTSELAAQLTMAGLEVDSQEPVAGEFNDVVVGLIEEAKPHPDAKKLQVCRVNVGKEQPLSIVCGAANARTGLKVAVAMIGAKLPIGLEIKATEIRGEPSKGMLCAESELAMAEKSDGIMELPVDAPIGEPVRHYLDLDDTAIEVDLTPNRGDCLSILGLARETAVLNQISFSPKPVQQVDVTSEKRFPVAISEPGHCPNYVGRVIEMVNSGVPTPLWIKERLRRSDIRSIDLVVDITNYVLLEMGQPMHAFDLDRLEGGIDVRLANKGEKLTLLDGQEIALHPDSLVIADQSGPLALAGVMGGEASGIKAGETTNLFLESAFFDPITIAGKARSYGLHTDSSHRFERGVDFALQQQAIERATQLVIEIAGGKAGPLVVESNIDAFRSALKEIHLREAKVESLLGFTLPTSEIETILTNLGLGVTAVSDGWMVKPTSFRFDIRIEVDLIEEIGRIYGYNQIPTGMSGHQAAHATQAKSLSTSGNQGSEPQAGRLESEVSLQTIKRCMVDRGYQEVISYSFVDASVEQLLSEHTDQADQLKLANPISSDLEVMRSSLWPGLIKTAQYNLNRQQNRLRMFETGQRFRLNQSGELEQQEVIAGLVYGPLLEERWCHERRSADFFDVKSDLMALFQLGRLDHLVELQAAEHKALHPGQSAQVICNNPTAKDGANEVVGWIGALHPSLENKLGFSGNLGKESGKIYLFELVLSAIRVGNSPTFRAISKFPSVQRDLALIIESKTPASALLNIIKANSGEWLVDTSLFDLYEGDNIGVGKKSMAVSITLQHPTRTLNDDEINGVIDQVITALQSELGAVLRE